MIETPDSTTAPARSTLVHLFLHHPASVGESYFEHMRFALGFAFWLGLGALAALLHAIFPFAYETTGSRIIRKLHGRIENRSETQ